MTYKAIVKEFIRKEAEQWVEQLLDKNNINYRFTFATVKEMENNKEADSIFWTVKVDITVSIYKTITVEVGGTADDIAGICKSVIWDSDYHIIWMSVEETRNHLGITEFKIA